MNGYFVQLDWWFSSVVALSFTVEIVCLSVWICFAICWWIFDLVCWAFVMMSICLHLFAL